MKKIKKLLTVIIVISSLLCAVCSCNSGSDRMEAELLAEFKEKYELSYRLNEYIWGSGLPAGEIDEGVTLNPYYVTVSEQAEYRTKAEFVADINKVYVSDFVSDEIETLLFVGYKDDGIHPRYGEIDGNISINVRDKGNENIGVGKFLTETARVKSIRGGTAVFTVTYLRDGVQKDYDIMMRLDGEGWKFESPTY